MEELDGTLCFSKWPELGEPNRPLIEYLIDQKRSGNKLILWTCRAGEALDKEFRQIVNHQSFEHKKLALNMLRTLFSYFDDEKPK